MAIQKKEIIDVIYKAIGEANNLAPSDAQIPLELESILLGKDSILDSLGLINLIVEVEVLLAKDLGVEVVILDEDELINPEGAYGTVRSFAESIMQRIKQ